MPRYSRQTIAPYPFTTETLAESNWRTVVVKMSNAVTVLRYLTSKLVFTEESFSSVEAVTLFTAFEECIRKVESDRGFQFKYGSEIFIFRAVYQNLESLARIKPSLRLKTMQETYGFYRGKVFSRRYFFAVEGQARKLYKTLLKQRFPKRFPAKTFVGKGYGDHGTAKNKALDGSPSWQEVAGRENYRGASSSERSIDYHRSYLIHHKQSL